MGTTQESRLWLSCGPGVDGTTTLSSSGRVAEFLRFGCGPRTEGRRNEVHLRSGVDTN